MDTGWFRGRSYRHFDNPITEPDLVSLLEPDLVAKHQFSPLIHHLAETRRYKSDIGKTVVKPRPIMYAGHRDAAILGWYSQKLNTALSRYYQDHDLDDNVIAYRAIGKSNYGGVFLCRAKFTLHDTGL